MNNKIYTDHKDLIRDITDNKSPDKVVYKCEMDLYVLITVYGYVDGCPSYCFSHYITNLYYVEYNNGEYYVYYGKNIMITKTKVSLFSYGFVSDTHMYFCFNKIQMLNIILIYKTKEANIHLSRLSKKYENYIKEIDELY